MNTNTQAVLADLFFAIAAAFGIGSAIGALIGGLIWIAA